MKDKILVVGRFPPPYHGANIMGKIMLSALKGEGYQAIFIDKSFSKSYETVGKPSLRKILRVPILAIKILIACLFRRPAMCIYFVAVGKSAFQVDAFLLFLLRLCHLPYILRFGDKGIRDLANQGYIWNLIVSVTLAKALGGMVNAETLKSDINLFIPNDRLALVPNAREKLTVVSEKTNKNVQILFLSNLKPTKGPMEVLKAANIVIKKHKNVRFVLAGADSLPSFTQKLRSYINDNGLDDYVAMPGGVHGEEKEKLYSASDIFVFPTCFEAFGTVNIEAMNWGLPVISSTEGAIPEIVQDRISGFLVNPKSPEEIANKLLTLVNNPRLRKKMGKKGREIFESKYTLEVYAKTLDGTIRSFLGKINCYKTSKSKILSKKYEL